MQKMPIEGTINPVEDVNYAANVKGALITLGAFSISIALLNITKYM